MKVSTTAGRRPVSPDDLIIDHLAHALTAHRKWCRSCGVHLPSALEALTVALAASAGQRRPGIGTTPTPVDADPVPVAPLLLNDTAAGQRLSVSARTVRRLRASGALPSVVAGKRRLIRTSDVEAFVRNGGSA